MKNRVIKFRVWNTFCKAYLKLYNGNKAIGLFIVSPFNSLCLNPAMRNEELIFEQFTGLTDKNGKEIYEGDVVKVSNPENKIGFNYPIEVKSVKMTGFWPFTQFEFIGQDETTGGDSRFEVIGNIHGKCGHTHKTSDIRFYK